LHPRPVRRHLGGPAGFAAALRDHTITAARRRGKYLWLPLEDGTALLAHLGMSGQLLIQPPGALAQRHLRVRFALAGAGGGQELHFVDQRMFGGLSVTSDATLPPEIAHIARDPVDPDFDPAAFTGRVRRSSSAIKRLLLDQTVISGVGNIYADEALWRAQLHGERPGNRLTEPVLHDLLGHIRDVMGDALAQGGTSFDALYVNVNGESGYFDRSLAVYGREDQPCRRCGTPIRRSAFMNRSSFFCPACQPAPRRARVVG
jgi:formamidopyrimidine-DNA glycosylase